MAVASARICISFISIPFCALFILNSLRLRRRGRGWLARLRRPWSRLFVRLVAKECCCRATGQYGFARRIGVRTLHLGRASALGVTHLHISYVDDSLQLSHALEEIQHRVIRPVNINGKRHFTVELFVAHRHGGIPPYLNARGCSRI